MELTNTPQIPSEYSRVCALINTQNARENLIQMHCHIPEETALCAVIKTNGYGHGALPLAKALDDLDFLRYYAVATAEEALSLRTVTAKPILILGHCFPYSYESLANNNISMPFFRPDTLPLLKEAAIKTGKKIGLHIKVDTGMSRIGLSCDEDGILNAAPLWSDEYKDYVDVQGIFTHFARADETDKSKAAAQYDRFTWFISRLQQVTGQKIPLCHCGNSAAIVDLPEYHLDMMRAGITLYGLHPSEETSRTAVPLKPVMSLYSHIAYTKTLLPGREISYGGTFTVEKEMRVATVPVGYGDGYPRGLSGKGYVLICGKKAPILGRVCMDQMMVDITHIPEAEEDTLVTLLGKDGSLCITAEELGALSGRFNYELVCCITDRVPRYYI